MTTQENDGPPPLGELPDIPGAETVVVDVHVSVWIRISLWIKNVVLSKINSGSTPAMFSFSLIVLGLYLVMRWASDGLGRLGGGISTPSFSSSWMAWISGIALVAAIGGLSYSLKKKAKKEKEEKPTAEKVVGEVKKEAPKKKKDESYHFFPFLFLMSFHWIGVLSVFFIGSRLLYNTLVPFTEGGGEMSPRDLQQVIWLGVGIVLLFHWINLVNGKKGPRPVAFAIGWIISVAGIVSTIGIVMQFVFKVPVF